MRNTFSFLNFQNLLELQGISSDKVVVVSIVGKSAYNAFGLKVKSIGRVFATDNNNEFSVDGLYDEENQIVYLHLQSLLDTDTLIKQYKHLIERCESERNCTDFLAVYDEVKSSFARALFFLLYISHIVVLSHPGSTFDTSYIQYFKAIDTLSQKLFDKITESLRSIDISSEWIANGRPCTPRLIFYFERCPKNVKNLKKLEHNLEDKIYHILKKTRIISTSGCSLFAIPLNDEFVYISDDKPPDRLGDAVRGLLLDCQPGGAMQVEVPYSSQSNSEKSFKKFLQVHIHQATNKGFDDTVTSGRHQHIQPLHFEKITMRNYRHDKDLRHVNHQLHIVRPNYDIRPNLNMH